MTVTADGEEEDEDEEGLLDLEEVRDLGGSCVKEDASLDFFERELESYDPFGDLDKEEADRDEVRLLELRLAPHSLDLEVVSSVSSHTSSTVTKSSMLMLKSSKR